MVKSVQDVVRGMELPDGYNHEALTQLADIADAQAARIDRLEWLIKVSADMLAKLPDTTTNFNGKGPITSTRRLEASLRGALCD